MTEPDIGDTVYWINFKSCNEPKRVYVAIEELTILDIDYDSEECFLFEDYYNNSFWANQDEVFITYQEAFESASKLMRSVIYKFHKPTGDYEHE